MQNKFFVNARLQIGLAARNLMRQSKRSSFALLIVCGGVIAVVLAGGFINWIFGQLREGAIYSQLGHIQITRPHFFDRGLSDPYRYLLPKLTPNDVPNVGDLVTLTPRLSLSGLISRGDETIAFLGEGIDPKNEAPISRAMTIISGKDLAHAGPRSVIVGEGLAANLGVKIGDKLILVASTAQGGMNAVELELVGVFATISKAYDDTMLRMPIAVAQELVRVQGATSYVALLGHTENTNKALSQMRQTLAAKDYELVPWTDLADFYNKTVSLFSKQVGVVRILTALIVVLSISNTLSMSVLERTSEIGTLLALGTPRREVLKLFLWEGLLLGIAGGVLGVLIGIGLAVLISAIGIPMPPPPGMARGYIGQIEISSALAMQGFLLAFSTTLLASIFPALKASRMNIVDALRHAR